MEMAPKVLKNLELGCKVENHIIRILLKHLSVEAEIFKAKNDVYSLNWAIFALINANKEVEDLVENSISILEKEAEKIAKDEFSLTTELVIKFALGERILKSKNRKNPKITKAMKILLEKSKDKNWFNSQETVSMLLFLLSESKMFSSELNSAYEWLYTKYNHFVGNKNYLKIIDSSLGLLSYNKEVEVPFEEIIKNLELQSIERISKFLMCLAKSEKEGYFKDVIPLLERKLNDKFGDWIFPNLEMSLFEGINLSNSNLSREDMSAIIENLRENDEEWTKFIDVDKNGLLLKNIDEIEKIPAFNVKEDALSLLALLGAGRRNVYQLNEDEHKLVAEVLKEHKEGYTGIKKSHINNFFYSSLFLMAFLLILSGYFLGILPNVMFELLKAPSIYSLVKTSSYWAVFALLLIFYYRIGSNLISKGEVSRKELILLFPFVKTLYSKIKGEEQNEE